MRFAEREGFKSARQAIQLDGMDGPLRNSLWNILTIVFFPDIGGYLQRLPKLERHVHAIWSDYFKKPTDTIGNLWSSSRDFIKEWFFSAQWYEVYDFIEFCDQELPYSGPGEKEAFEKFCNEILQREMSGYRLVGGHFIKNTSPEELGAIDTAQTPTGKFDPVSTHLRAALDHLTRREKPDYRNSIKESISAVEAICSIIAGAPKASLGQALKKLEQSSFKLHAAQKEAFNKLYGYTSDADGIRHALLDEQTLTYEDAQFMLVTCSAFVNYLRAAAKQ